MYSIAFPKIFSNNNTLLYSDYDATLSNLKLMLKSYKKATFGDPYYGNNLPTYLYDTANHIIMEELIIDDIYTSVKEFMPQLRLRREDIKVIDNGYSLDVEIYATNILNNKNDLYSIRLIEGDE